MSAPTLGVPAIRQAAHDRRLTPIESRAVAVLWAHLSSDEYRPMKMESLGALLGIRRESASKIMRRLVAVGYVDEHCGESNAHARHFLLIGICRDVAA